MKTLTRRTGRIHGLLFFSSFCVLCVLCDSHSCLSARAAPAPIAKLDRGRVAKLNLLGKWQLSWGENATYTYSFREDGTCSDGGSYTGTWRLDQSADGKKRTLYVFESSKPEEVTSFACWAVNLDKSLTGEAEYIWHPSEDMRGRKYAVKLVRWKAQNEE